jgi:DNA-binding XRE family transcriptional regulator
METADLTPLERAIAKANGQVPLAKALGVTQQAISAAKRSGRVSPALAIKIGLFLGEEAAALYPALFTLRGRDAA